MARKATRDMPRVGVREAAAPGAPPCPACTDPLFQDLEAEGGLAATRRCETCGVIVCDGSGGPDLLAELRAQVRELAPGPPSSVRFANAASVQAMFGAESWSRLDRTPGAVNLTPEGVRRAIETDGVAVTETRSHLRSGMASMWLTILNLLTFHRNFALEALSRRLRPEGAGATAKFVVDAAISILIAVPVAAIAVLIEGLAVLARRGGELELGLERVPDPDH